MLAEDAGWMAVKIRCPRMSSVVEALNMPMMGTSTPTCSRSTVALAKTTRHTTDPFPYALPNPNALRTRCVAMKS